MTAVLQRVSSAFVACEGKTAGSISQGLVILLGVAAGDGESEAEALAVKAACLRIFDDAAGKLGRSLLDTGGSALVVSNFTLCADLTHGRRPDFTGAAGFEKARTLYERFCDCLREQGISNVQTGVFGGDMKLTLTNDGPVTIIMDSARL